MAADDRLLADEANELLADGARAADSQALDYDLRSDHVAASASVTVPAR